MPRSSTIDISRYSETELNALAREAKREQRRLYMQKWRRNNPEKSRINSRNSYARRALRKRATLADKVS